jgi:hypothetical protein
MRNILIAILMVAFAMTGTAIAANFPGYYPAKGFPNTGRVDAVYAEEGRVVIGDVSYRISDAVRVRSLSSKNDSLARIRTGVLVGFKTTSGQVIEEFWLLPGNYKPRESRTRR